MAGRVQDYVGGGNYHAPPMDEGGRRGGIEIEIEGVREFHSGMFGVVTSPESKVPFGTYWNIKLDNSLRNSGAEFLTQPLTLSELELALEEFYREKKKFPKWQSSSRCGIHVHADARDYKMENFGALFAAYSLVEPALFEFVGPDREECIYCVPWYRAPNDADAIVNKMLAPRMKMSDFLPTVEHGNSLRHRLSKYSAFFWSPLAWYGTVEFRQAPTWETSFPAQRWVKACWSIVEYCSTRTEEQIWKEWTESKRGFLSNLVGGHVPIYPEAIQAVDFWDIEERIERLHKVPIEDNWKPKLRETGLAKRKRRTASKGIKLPRILWQDDFGSVPQWTPATAAPVQLPAQADAAGQAINMTYQQYQQAVAALPPAPAGYALPNLEDDLEFWEEPQ